MPTDLEMVRRTNLVDQATVMGTADSYTETNAAMEKATATGMISALEMDTQTGMAMAKAAKAIVTTQSSVYLLPGISIDQIQQIRARVKAGDFGKGAKLFADGRKCSLWIKGLDFDERIILTPERMAVLVAGGTLAEAQQVLRAYPALRSQTRKPPTAARRTTY